MMDRGLVQALRDSLFYTDDTDRVLLYLVNDYCYYMWWLAAAESSSPGDNSIESPLEHLLQVTHCFVSRSEAHCIGTQQDVANVYCRC